MKKMYCLVVINDYSRFTWIFFLAIKDETSGILAFITGIENLVDHKVKVIRCDNGTEFKNREMNQFCEMKGILRQFSVARTPQQNRVVERRNRTLIEVARTMLADSKLSTTFWAEAVNIACYADEGFFVGYSLNSKAFRVFNSRTKTVEENLHIRFSESTPNVVGSGTDWLFDIDALTRTMNYEPIVAGTQSNDFVGTKASDNAGQARKKTEPVKDYILLPLWTIDPPYSQDPKSSHNDGSKPSSDDGKKVDEDPKITYNAAEYQMGCYFVNKARGCYTNNVNAASINEVNAIGGKTSIELPFDPNMPALKDYNIFDFSRDDEDDGAVVDMNNLDTIIQVSPILTIRIYKDHPLNQVIGDLKNPKGNSCIEGSKLDKGYARRASTIQVIKSLDFRNIQEEGIDYDGVFAPVARIEAIRLFLAYASFKDLVVYQVDVHMYRSMIGSLMYLTSSRLDIIFVVCACARYQVNPKVSHLYAIKRIFSDYAGASLDRKSITRGCQFLGCRLISWQCKKQTVVANSIIEAGDCNEKKLIQMVKIHTDKNIADLLTKAFDLYLILLGKAKKSVKLMMEKLFRIELELMLVKTINGEAQLHALVDGKKIIITESSVRRDLQLADEKSVECLPNSTIFEQLTLMGPKTTAWNEFSSTMAFSIICLATN
ncbi:ribonuclease H-like domain-containing protein [Tanacetum coccineum]